jgi:zinc protease
MVRRLSVAAVAAIVFAASLSVASLADSATIARSTLANGLRIIAVRDTLAPVVTVEMNYLVGSQDDPPAVPGMAHAQEHMMFRGSTGVSGAQLASIAAALGGDLNGDTQTAATQYLFTVPSNALDIVLHIEADRMRGVIDAQADWIKERGAIEQEVSSDVSNPIYRARQVLAADMFVGTPYAQPGVGTREAFDALTSQDLKTYYDAWYQPNNAVLVIVGDIDPPSVVAGATRLFSAIPSAPVPPHPTFALPAPKLEDVAFDTDLPYGIALVAYRFPGTDSPDFAAALVLSDVISDQRSPFFSGMPFDKLYNASFVIDDMPKASLGIAEAIALQPKDVPDVERAVVNNLGAATRAGFSPELVEDAKRKEISQDLFQRSSIQGLAEAWSAAVAVEGRSSPDDDVAAIKAVSADDVNRVAAKYLTASTEISADLTPKSSGAPVPADAFGADESFAPTAAKPVPPPSWAAALVNSTDVAPSTLRPVDTTLSNGMRVIVQNEPGSGSVIVRGEVRNDPDVEAPSGKEGVSLLLDQLFTAGPSTESTYDFFTDVGQIGADEVAGSSFSLRVPAANFDRGMMLLADNELRPSLPSARFAQVRTAVADRVAGLSQTPGYIAEQSLYAALYPKDDAIQRTATVASVQDLSLSDIRAYYNATIRPDLTTIVIVGDVDPDHALSIIKARFGGWTASGTPPVTTLPPAPPNKPSALSVPALGSVQDSVTFAETLGVASGTPDDDALTLGDQMLASEFYASRLYRDLREQTGLVYYVSTAFEEDGGRKTYRVRFGCDPQNVSKVAGIVQRDLQSMQTQPPTPDELLRAKALAVRELPLGEASEAGIASVLLDRAVAGMPLDDGSVEKRYLRVTSSQIAAAFGKWIRPNDFVQIVQGPPPQ